MTRRHNVLAPLAWIFTAVVVAFGSTIPAFAATQSGNGGNGYKISPVRTDLTINPGETKTTDVYIQNVSSAVEDLQVVINDFQASTNESGTPALLLNGKQAPQHSLKQYVLPSSDFTLQPNEQKDVKITIAIPEDAVAGGYYGAVRFAPANVDASKNVTLSASVASLILVKVPGNIKEQVGIASFDARVDDHSRSVFTSSKNISAVVRFQNTGDVQEEPFGKIILKKGGKELATYEINNTDPRGNVLPGSIRKFSVKLTKVSSIGKYTLQGNFGYGSNGQLLSASTTFYVIPLWAIIVGIVVILLILAAIFLLSRKLRAHNRRVARKASRH
jgi:hypothetical protein